MEKRMFQGYLIPAFQDIKGAAGELKKHFYKGIKNSLWGEWL